MTGCVWCGKPGDDLERRESAEFGVAYCHPVCWEIWLDPAQRALALQLPALSATSEVDRG